MHRWQRFTQSKNVPWNTSTGTSFSHSCFYFSRFQQPMPSYFRGPFDSRPLWSLCPKILGPFFMQFLALQQMLFLQLSCRVFWHHFRRLSSFEDPSLKCDEQFFWVFHTPLLLSERLRPIHTCNGNYVALLHGNKVRRCQWPGECDLVGIYLPPYSPSSPTSDLRSSPS